MLERRNSIRLQPAVRAVFAFRSRWGQKSAIPVWKFLQRVAVRTRDVNRATVCPKSDGAISGLGIASHLQRAAVEGQRIGG